MKDIIIIGNGKIGNAILNLLNKYDFNTSIHAVREIEETLDIQNKVVILTCKKNKLYDLSLKVTGEAKFLVSTLYNSHLLDIKQFFEAKNFALCIPNIGLLKNQSTNICYLENKNNENINFLTYLGKTIFCDNEDRVFQKSLTTAVFPALLAKLSMSFDEELLQDSIDTYLNMLEDMTNQEIIDFIATPQGITEQLIKEIPNFR